MGLQEVEKYKERNDRYEIPRSNNRDRDNSTENPSLWKKQESSNYHIHIHGNEFENVKESLILRTNTPM